MYLKANFQDFGRFDRHRSRDCRRRRGLAAGADRAVTQAHRRRPQVRFRGARQALCGGAARHAGAGQIRRHHRLGCEPDHHRRGCVPRSTPRSRTTTGRWSATPSAMPGRTACGTFDKPHRWIGLSGGAGVGYNAPASLGAALANKRHGRLTRDVQRRRRSDVRAEHAVDGGPPPHPAALHRAQQPRLSPGIHVPAGDGEPARPRHREHRISAPRSPIRTSITPRWRAASGSMARARSPTRTSLRPALKRALAAVRRGEPALIDVVTDPR